MLLDGFDEVSTQWIPNLLRSIEELSLKYPKINIVVTSRHESECSTLTLFSSISLKPLRSEDLYDFFKKITKDVAFTERLVSAVNASAVGIKALVSTPLVATLLAIVYRAGGKMPDEFSEFFEELFQVLLLRHDASKLGWRRERASELTDRQLQNFFGAFCFQVRRRKLLSLSRDDGAKIAQEGLDAIGLKADSVKCLADIKKVTCLILEESRKIEFVHSSVAYFFASKFISGLTDGQAEAFYGQLLAGHWRTWLSEIDFLKQIDEYRLYKNFILPDIRDSISMLSSEDGIERIVGHYLDSCRLLRAHDGKGIPKYFVEGTPLPMTYSCRSFRAIFFDTLFTPTKGCRNWEDVARSMADGQKMTWRELCNARGQGVIEVIKGEIFNNTLLLRSSLQNAEGVINRVESSGQLISL